MFLEELIQEEASFLCPFGLHLTVRAAVAVLEVEGLAVGVAFSLVLGIQEPLRPHPVDDPEFVEFLVQCLGAHAIVFRNGRGRHGPFAGKDTVGIIGFRFQLTDYLFCAGRFQFGVLPGFPFGLELRGQLDQRIRIQQGFLDLFRCEVAAVLTNGRRTSLVIQCLNFLAVGSLLERTRL
nr:MAG TPA: hypothetical protein [Caudoviricetes sp.]